MSKTRKLAAIVFVDIVNYTSMMGKDEQATIHLLEKFRELLYPLARNYHGAVLKELGDGALVRFDSVLDATHYAMKLQQSVKSIPNLRLRIGIHMGDVLLEKNDVFGSGVNVAARIPPLAAPGGIVLTEDVWKQIMNRPEFSFVPLGSRHLKGLHRATRVFSLTGDGLAVPGFRQRLTSNRIFKSALLSVLLTGAVTLAYMFFPQVRQVARTNRVPSIAILSLTNSGPETDEFLSYGMTEDLIADVTKAGLVRVAPMSSVQSYQKSKLPIEEIAQRLNIQYVLEGELRREGDALRLNGQIFEASTGKIVWTDRMRAKLTDIASLQGKLVEAIISSLNVQTEPRAIRHIRKPSVNPAAYESYLRGKYFFDRRKTEADNAVARGMYDQAVSLDSGFVDARIGLGQTYEVQKEYGTALKTYETALSLAKATVDKTGEGRCLASLGQVLVFMDDLPRAREYSEQALRIFSEVGDKNSQSTVIKRIGDISLAQGDHMKSLDSYTQVLTLQQQLGDRQSQGTTLGNLGTLYSTIGDYATAIDYYQQSLTIARESSDSAGEASILNKLGQCYTSVGEYEKAAEYLNQSLGISRGLGDGSAENQSRVNISTVLFYTGNYEASLEVLRQLLKKAKDDQDREGEASLMECMGKTHLARGNMEQAIKLLSGSVDLFDRLGERNGRVRALSWLALAETKARKPAAALAHLKRIEADLDTTQKQPDFAGICWNVAQSYDLLKNSEKRIAVLTWAYKEVASRARRIADNDVRQGFLTKVKQHRDIKSAWDSLFPPDTVAVKSVLE